MRIFDYNLFINESNIDEVNELETEAGKSEYVGKKYPITDPKDIKNFMFAGKSIFTIESTVTSDSFTYKISKLKNPKTDSEKNLYFVAVLRGPGVTGYGYLGKIYYERFSLTAKSKFAKKDIKGNFYSDDICVKAFQYFYNKLMNGEPDTRINFYHMGICGRCGKALTVPESIKFGFGPHCAKIVIDQDAAKFGI